MKEEENMVKSGDSDLGTYRAHNLMARDSARRSPKPSLHSRRTEEEDSYVFIRCVVVVVRSKLKDIM